MLFSLNFPVESIHSPSGIFNREFLLEAPSSPKRSEVLKVFKNIANKIDAGLTIYNGAALVRDLKTAIAQLEAISDEDFPTVNQITTSASCVISSTIGGTKRITMRIVIPIRI